ncbi:hypothetical protein CPB97_002337 [Podila verticillata]|nr:hypothetical protein CPB97_002337 [Podila verticillata]
MPKPSSFSINPPPTNLAGLDSRPAIVRIPGCTHVVCEHDACACALKDSVDDAKAFCIGDPSIPGPSSNEWAKTHREAKSLTLSASTATTTNITEYNLTVVKTLREIHVKHPLYLGLKLASATTSRHWLHDMAVRNRSLEKLTLHGPGSPEFVYTQIVPFKISNYFGHGSKALLRLSIQSLSLRHFILSDTELDNLLNFCPRLKRLELEHVCFETESNKLLPHNGLQEIVLTKTEPTLRLLQVLAGVHTFVLKGHVDPPVSLSRMDIRWRISRYLFERYILGMSLLLTVKLDRVDFLLEDLRKDTDAIHDRVVKVFNTEGINIRAYFPKAVIKPYWHALVVPRNQH